MNTYICMYVSKCTQHIHVHINTFKAIKDIAAGQELFLRYGGANWFQCKNIPCTDVDYASTMWRPDLHPLPCRQNVDQATGADGRHSYTVVEAVPSGSVLEISLCLEVSVSVVDQFPYLWDFVLTYSVLIGETGRVYSLLSRQHTSAFSRAHTACVFADQGEGNIGGHAERVSFFISPFAFTHSLPIPKPVTSKALWTI